jgi:hypothetical protein
VRSRLVSFLAAALVAGAFAGGAAPAGVAQTSGCLDPLYCPQETPSVGPTGTGGLTKAQRLKKCKAKAQSKFGDNRPKQKAAIKKCKKKYR